MGMIKGLPVSTAITKSIKLGMQRARTLELLLNRAFCFLSCFVMKPTPAAALMEVTPSTASGTPVSWAGATAQRAPSVSLITAVGEQTRFET